MRILIADSTIRNRKFYAPRDTVIALDKCEFAITPFHGKVKSFTYTLTRKYCRQTLSIKNLEQVFFMENSTSSNSLANTHKNDDEKATLSHYCNKNEPGCPIVSFSMLLTSLWRIP